MAFEDLQRVCGKCHTEKPIDEFYPAPRRGRMGRAYYCKPCANEASMQSYLKGRERKHRWYCKNLDGNRMKHSEWQDT